MNHMEIFTAGPEGFQTRQKVKDWSLCSSSKDANTELKRKGNREDEITIREAT